MKDQEKETACKHRSIMYINSDCGWLCLDCKAFSTDKVNFTHVVSPPPEEQKVNKLVDAIKEAMANRNPNPKAFTGDDMIDFLSWYRLRNLKRAVTLEKNDLKNESDALCKWMEEKYIPLPKAPEKEGGI